MSTTPYPITFQGLLKEHKCIRIPRLQRDYAQGRKGAKETNVRNAFLDVLCDALVRVGSATFTPLNLDFVYGTAVEVPTKHFAPLDGQQRLTTLFLLHWLLAWRDGDDAWKHFTETFCDSQGCSCFSYDVRTSSGEFFDGLVSHRPPLLGGQGSGFDLRGWITDQPWYFQYWRLDPTVQGVLEMLQTMHRHALFLIRPGTLYRQLTDIARPAITFQLLELKEFPLSDDLYIKMNARGKPLTAFETFKARYETKLQNHFRSTPPRAIGGALFPMPEFVSRRLDIAWTDFFWAFHRETGPLVPQRVDESFMNLFRMVALASRDPAQATSSYNSDIDLLRSKKNPPTYSAFDAREWLDPEFSAVVVSLMESWLNAGFPLSSGGLFDEQTLLRRLFHDSAELSVSEVVMFCGYAMFVRKYEGRFQAAELGEWMRIVHNLGYNSDIDRNDRLQNAAQGLRELLSLERFERLPLGRSILSRVAEISRETGITGFRHEQKMEESLKAELLLADSAGWRPLIDQAERHGYFRGQIGFLLKFAGVTTEWERTGDCKWSVPLHERFQESFRTYLAKAQMMFDDDGLVDLGDDRWTRALLSLGDYLLSNGGANHSFLENDRSKPLSWKRLLRDDTPQRNLVQRLWDHPDYQAPLPEGLDSIISSASDLEPWRQALVHNVEAIRYCKRRNIQHEANNHVILLRKERLSAPHAELFTYLLYPHMQPPAPFSKGEYHERVEPHIPLGFLWGGDQRCIELRGSDGNFELWLKLVPPDALQTLLEQRGGFVSAGVPTEWIKRRVDSANLQQCLQEIASILISP